MPTSELKRFRLSYEFVSEANRLGRCDGYPMPYTKKGYLAIYVPDPKMRNRYTHWKVEWATWSGYTLLRSEVPVFYRGKIEEVK